MLENFEVVSSESAQTKLLDTIISIVPDAIKNSDDDMLKLSTLFQEKGQFDDNEFLCNFIQDYV